ncbi:hypothetical protein DL98DRAFT_215129 [Cadophora sp. DSE1049]|nr:hypothetical protein DL98DRAFT_215129 [Cadophora sp. DSE1049]
MSLASPLLGPYLLRTHLFEAGDCQWAKNSLKMRQLLLFHSSFKLCLQLRVIVFVPLVTLCLQLAVSQQWPGNKDNYDSLSLSDARMAYKDDSLGTSPPIWYSNEVITSTFQRPSREFIIPSLLHDGQNTGCLRTNKIISETLPSRLSNSTSFCSGNNRSSPQEISLFHRIGLAICSSAATPGSDQHKL